MKVVLELTAEEYADLERRAKAERRTPEQMAEWLVVKGVVPVQSPGVSTWTFRPNPYDGNTWGGPLLPGAPGGPPAVLCSGPE